MAAPIEAWLAFNGECVLRGTAVGGKAHWEAIDLGEEATDLLLKVVANTWRAICGDCWPADAAAIVNNLKLLSWADFEVAEAVI